MTEQIPLEKKLVNTHVVKCRGRDKEENPVLAEGEAEEVIVKVYADGHTIPLCRHYYNYYEYGQCRLGKQEVSGDNPFCIYFSRAER